MDKTFTVDANCIPLRVGTYFKFTIRLQIMGFINPGPTYSVYFGNEEINRFSTSEEAIQAAQSYERLFIKGTDIGRALNGTRSNVR